MPKFYSAQELAALCRFLGIPQFDDAALRRLGIYPISLITSALKGISINV